MVEYQNWEIQGNRNLNKGQLSSLSDEQRALVGGPAPSKHIEHGRLSGNPYRVVPVVLNGNQIAKMHSMVKAKFMTHFLKIANSPKTKTNNAKIAYQSMDRLKCGTDMFMSSMADIYERGANLRSSANSMMKNAFLKIGSIVAVEQYYIDINRPELFVVNMDKSSKDDACGFKFIGDKALDVRVMPKILRNYRKRTKHGLGEWVIDKVEYFKKSERMLIPVPEMDKIVKQSTSDEDMIMFVYGSVDRNAYYIIGKLEIGQIKDMNLFPDKNMFNDKEDYIYWHDSIDTLCRSVPYKQIRTLL
jgi:hypothetical protein